MPAAWLKPGTGTGTSGSSEETALMVLKSPPTSAAGCFTASATTGSSWSRRSSGVSRVDRVMNRHLAGQGLRVDDGDVGAGGCRRSRGDGEGHDESAEPGQGPWPGRETTHSTPPKRRAVGPGPH